MKDAAQNLFRIHSEVLGANDNLANFSRLLSFDADQTIIKAEDLVDKVYFILSGSVKITSFSAKGKEIWHGTREAGGTFGDISALTGRHQNASVVTLVPTRLAVITKAELYSLMRQDVEIAIWLLEAIAHRLTDATEKLQDVISLSLPQRIRAELLRLALLENKQNDDGFLLVEPVPNLTVLAKRLNTEREIVSREVSALVKRGALHKDRNHMVLLDRTLFENSQS